MNNQKNENATKIVLITGVTKGLGRALAEKFKELGWHIVGCGINEEAIVDLQKEFENGHIFSTVDVSDSKAVEDWAQQTVLKVYTPDIIINNAGVINRLVPLWEITPQEFNKVMSVNVNGQFNVLHAFIPAMIKQDKGLIINISSSAGREGEATFAPYCASKFAIEGLTKSLAQELPKNITAVSLDPGAINTDMFKACYPEEAHKYPTADQWAQKAVPFILNITPKDNGKTLIIK